MQDISTLVVRHRRGQIERSALGSTVRYGRDFDVIDIVLVAFAGRVIKSDIERLVGRGAITSHDGLCDIDRALSVGVGGVFVAEELDNLLHLALMGILGFFGWVRHAGGLRGWIHGRDGGAGDIWRGWWMGLGL